MVIQDCLILVVDDDEGIRQLLRMVLARSGYRVATAADGAAALKVVAQSPPDLIFLDLWMPAMDGWAFAREYRRTPGPHAPIVVLSADRELSTHAQEMEAAAFLRKPFDLDDLQEMVSLLAGTQGNGAAGERHVPQPPHQAVEILPSD